MESQACKKIIVALILLLIIIIVGCETYKDKNNSNGKLNGDLNNDLKKVRLAVSKIEATALVRVALAKGYFEKNGLDVNFTEQDIGKFSLEEIFEDRADIATVAETPIVKKSFEQNNFEIFATIHRSSNNVKVIARKDSGITVPLDLKGKKVGTSRATAGDFFLYSFLINSGLGNSDINISYGDPQDLISSLADGKIDALSLREPHIFRAKMILGDNAVIFSPDFIYTSTFNLVAKSNFIKNNPDIIRRFLNALIEAEDFVRENRDEAILITSNDLQIGIDYLNQTWEESQFELRLDQELLLSLDEEARWIAQNSLIDAQEIPNYLDYVNPDILNQIKKEAVTVIK